MYYPDHFHLFDDFFSTDSNLLRTDIHEKDGNYVLNMEVPGYRKEDIQIELKDGYLNITANKSSDSSEKDDQGRVVRKERYSGTCSRSFYIGDGYKQSDIKASFDNGELKITLPTQAAKVEDQKQYIAIE
nr:Hsp20/alpha crystallin family protein [Catenisphaera adipataccumulans]